MSEPQAHGSNVRYPLVLCLHGEASELRSLAAHIIGNQDANVASLVSDLVDKISGKYDIGAKQVDRFARYLRDMIVGQQKAEEIVAVELYGLAFQRAETGERRPPYEVDVIMRDNDLMRAFKRRLDPQRKETIAGDEQREGAFTLSFAQTMIAVGVDEGTHEYYAFEHILALAWLAVRPEARSILCREEDRPVRRRSRQ